MPTARQSAANSFYFDDEGNVQRTPTHGTYGFRGWWEKSNDFTGGLPMNYDWKKMDRPKIERAPAGPLFGKPPPKKPRADTTREPEPRSGLPPRFGNRTALPPGPMSDVNDPRSHTLFNVNVPGMTTDPFGEMGGRRGALPPGSQFDGTYIDQPTALSSQRALGPGGGNFPNAIDTTSTT